MTTKPFDPHRIIKELASAVWECPALHTPVQSHRCKTCGGWVSEEPNRIVPFASLRVECDGRPIRGEGHYHGDLYDAGSYQPDCPGWIPEPDVEKARWRIAKVLADTVKDDVEARHLVDNMDDDSLLLLAEAWLDEKMKGKTP